MAVGTKFYIGWRQLDAERLNAGLDRNIDNSSKIRYSVNGGFTWLNSPFPGSAMIRPIFSTSLDSTLTQEDFLNKKEIVLFPNPTTDIVYFMEDNIRVPCNFILYNSIGQFIESNYASEVELINLERGIYFIQFPEVSTKIFKIVKQ
ncbi:MAG: T9SS type A sorting domain-containing protein [Bacteroidota bacterium]